MKIQAFDPSPLPDCWASVGARTLTKGRYAAKLGSAADYLPAAGLLRVVTETGSVENLIPGEAVSRETLGEFYAAILAAMDGAILPGESVSIDSETGRLVYASDRDLRAIVLARFGHASPTPAPSVEVQIEPARVEAAPVEEVRQVMREIFGR